MEINGGWLFILLSSGLLLFSDNLSAHSYLGTILLLIGIIKGEH